MAQDTNLNTLIINKLTKAQYNAAEKSDNELYMVTDETYYTADEVDQKLQNVSVDLTGYAKETYVDQKVADLVGSSPDTLDTLNELASALGNDPNFATTITNQLAKKADKSYVDETAYKNNLPQINLGKYAIVNSNNLLGTFWPKASARKYKSAEPVDEDLFSSSKLTRTYNDNYYFIFKDNEKVNRSLFTNAVDDRKLYNEYLKDIVFNTADTSLNDYEEIKFVGKAEYCYLRIIAIDVTNIEYTNFKVSYINASDGYNPGPEKDIDFSLDSSEIIAGKQYDVMLDIPLAIFPYNNSRIKIKGNIGTGGKVYFKIVYDDTLTFPNKSGTIALQEDVDLKANTADLAKVAKTGSFTDLNNIPSIPSVESTATANSTNAISSGYVYTLEDKLTNGTDGYKVMTAEYADNVPVISTNISTDAESDIKTTSPKAVKSYVDENVVANPTLTGSETSLTSIGIGGTNFSVGGSSVGGYDFSNITPIVGTWDATNLWYSTSQINFEVTKKYSNWNEGTRQPYDLTEYITNGAKALYVGCARFNNTSSSNTKYSKDVGTPDTYGSSNKYTIYGWKMIPLNIPFTTTELLASYKSSQGLALSFLQAEYNPSTKKITMYVNGYNSETGSGTTSWYAHYFILAIY